MAGHVFVIRGDMRRLACDAWLLPCDTHRNVVPHWLEAFRGEPPPSDPGHAYLARLREYFDVSAFPHRGLVYKRYTALAERLEEIEDWDLDGGRVATLCGWTEALGPRPYLVNLGSHATREIEWYLEGLRQYLERVNASFAGRPARLRRARPLVACHAVGTGYGGAGWRKAMILWPQLELLQAFVERPECVVDVVFVAWEESTFAAAQACRRSPETKHSLPAAERLWPELSEPQREAARALARRAAAGNLVLFLGAGVSKPAGLPDWRGLLAEAASGHPELAEQLEPLQDLDVLDQAELIERYAPDLRQSVAARLRTAQHALGHALLASLPVDEVVTQNYDRLYEIAAEACERPVAVIPGSEATDARRWLLKMHGSISDPADIVLTRGDYLRYGERRAALAGIVQALLITKHMVFVGFSLGDPNFHRIADDVRKVLRPHGRETASAPFGAVLLLNQDELREKLWEGDLNLLPVAPAAAEVPAAARLHDIFLDYLLYEATASAAYLLDPDYMHALSPEELELREALIGLRPLADKLQGSPTWEAVERLLRELGARGDC